MNPILPLKQRFFSSDQLGVVITSSDFVALSNRMGFDLPKKSGEVLLVQLIDQIKKTNKQHEFAKYSYEMVIKRALDLDSLIKPYSLAQSYYHKHLQKAHTFAHELQKGLDLE